MTSPSLMPPTALCMTLSFTASVESFSRVSLTASMEPWTSALSIRFSSLTSPLVILSYRSARLTRAVLSLSFSRLFFCLMEAICFAVASSLTTTKVSPAEGTSESPSISIGIDGPASSILLPQSLIMALILP